MYILQGENLSIYLVLVAKAGPGQFKAAVIQDIVKPSNVLVAKAGPGQFKAAVRQDIVKPSNVLVAKAGHVNIGCSETRYS